MGTCIECGAELAETKSNLEQYWDNEVYLITDVPALICTQCSEKYFDGKMLLEIEEMLKQGRNIRTVKHLEYKVA